MSTPDQTGEVDPMAEAYHTLAAIQHQWDKNAAQLQEVIAKASQESGEVLTQIQQAQEAGDQQTVEQLQQRYADLHRAHAVAVDELEKHPDHHPERPEATPIDHQPEED